MLLQNSDRYRENINNIQVSSSDDDMRGHVDRIYAQCKFLFCKFIFLNHEI